MLLGQSKLEVQRPIGSPRWQTVAKEWNKVGLRSWAVAKAVAQDRKCWSDSMEAWCAYWHDKTWWWWWWWWNPDLEGQALQIYFNIFIELATVTQHRDREWNKTCVPIHFPPSPFNGCTTPPGSMPPTLYKQQYWFFYVPQESEQWKSCETGSTVFHPCLRGLMSQPRQHILLRLFKTLSVDLAGVWTHDLPLSRPALIQ